MKTGELKEFGGCGSAVQLGGGPVGSTATEEESEGSRSRSGAYKKVVMEGASAEKLIGVEEDTNQTPIPDSVQVGLEKIPSSLTGTSYCNSPLQYMLPVLEHLHVLNLLIVKHHC